MQNSELTPPKMSRIEPMATEPMARAGLPADGSSGALPEQREGAGGRLTRSAARSRRPHPRSSRRRTCSPALPWPPRGISSGPQRTGSERLARQWDRAPSRKEFRATKFIVRRPARTLCLGQEIPEKRLPFFVQTRQKNSKNSRN